MASAPANDTSLALRGSSVLRVVRPAAAAAADADAEFGFRRPDFGKEELHGTVEFHQRHVFLCYKSPAEWPSHIEATETDLPPRVLADAIKARESDIMRITKLTICESEDGIESSMGDVLIFPDMVRYRGLHNFDVDNFVEEVLVKDVEWLPGIRQTISGSYVFVCSHGSRDKRSGVCGPALISRFKEEIEVKGLNGQVAVSSCSDVEGHKYAGNVIIFSSGAKREVTGHWYGYVTPDDVPMLLDGHIAKGEIVHHLWRGELGMTKDEQKKAWAEATVKTNFLIPPGFNGEAPLDSTLHGFGSAGQLKDAIRNTHQWISTKMVLGLLKNASTFAVDSKRIHDKYYQVSGAVCVLKQTSDVPLSDHLYTTRILTETELLPERIEKEARIGDIYIERHDIGGKRWTMRRFCIKGDNTYHILQWRRRKPDDEYYAKRSSKPTKKKSEDEDEAIIKAVKMIDDIEELTPNDKAKAIMFVKVPRNRRILSTIKTNDVRASWLREEIKAKERLPERGEEVDPCSR